MAPRNATRVEAVKRLRAVASRLGVERAADNASKSKVTEMHEAIRAAAGLSEEEQKEVQAAWESYQSTRGRPPSVLMCARRTDAVPPTPVLLGGRLWNRGRTIILTWRRTFRVPYGPSAPQGMLRPPFIPLKEF